jgi:hypothetical protein
VSAASAFELLADLRLPSRDLLRPSADAAYSLAAVSDNSSTQLLRRDRRSRVVDHLQWLPSLRVSSVARPAARS